MKKAVMTALLAGSALAASGAASRADELSDLKDQIELLDARVVALKSVPPSVAGNVFVALSEGRRVDTPGLSWNGRERAAYGSTSTHISVWPVADETAGAVITWSGYIRSGAIYESTSRDVHKTRYDWRGDGSGWVPDVNYDGDSVTRDGDISVQARSQIRVTARTATPVGEVGTDIRLRGNFIGNGAASIYSDLAWGYWSMTPGLTFGTGYGPSLGTLATGLNGDCVCYYTDNSDITFDPGDVTQLRLSYRAGPINVGAALEDASFRARGDDVRSNSRLNGDRMGAAGEITYTADGIYAEIAGVWRDFKNFEGINSINALWQLGAGLRLPLGGLAEVSAAVAFGQGPVQNTDEGEIVSGSARNNSWWGVSGLASSELTEQIHAEIGAGYMRRDLDRYVDSHGDYTSGGQWGQWTALAGLYYNPVNQLTLGIEGEWIDTSFTDVVFDYETPRSGRGGQNPDYKYDVDVRTTSFTVDFVSVWQF